MAKTIAVWGAPGVGKTTLATKLAEVIHDRRHSTAVVLYADMDIPALPSLFPNYTKKELYSVGIPLSKADMTKEDVMKQIVTVRGKEKLGFLGFTDGENRYSYPRFDEDKVGELVSILLRNAKYVILDCTSSLDNPISAYGVCSACGDLIDKRFHEETFKTDRAVSCRNDGDSASAGSGVCSLYPFVGEDLCDRK